MKDISFVIMELLLICKKLFVLNKKWLPRILILLMVVAVIVAKTCKYSNYSHRKPGVTTNDNRKDPASNKTGRDKAFDRRTVLLEYSNHAKCRMQCRHISQAEVEEIMRDGEINYNKSDLQNDRCPRYAVEGITQDNQNVRIVFAQCNEKTEVVTVIDLNTEWSCHCPGDDGSASSPQKNRN